MSLDLDAEFEPYITLVRIEVRERMLASLRGSSDYGDVSGGKLGKHDYIILTVKDKKHTSFSFVAEKMRKRALCAGMHSHIHMFPLSQLSSAASASRSRFVWQFDVNPRPGVNQIVSTTDLNTILTNTGHHYSLISDNCWSYATRTVEAVLNLCLQHSQRRQNLEGAQGCREALQQLETVKRPLPRDVFRLVYKPLSHQNSDTLHKIGNWVSSKYNRR